MEWVALALIMFDVIQHDETFDIQSKTGGLDLRVIGFLLTAVKADRDLISVQGAMWVQLYSWEKNNLEIE